MGNTVSYKNGNYMVTLDLDTGTKTRENDLDTLEPAFPECFDIKITNRCHNNCIFCHEDSSCEGSHGNIMSEPFLDKLHPYTEISIGGGNPLEHPDLLPFLGKLKLQKVIPSLTVRQNDFMDNLKSLRCMSERKLIYGLGISLTSPEQSGFIQAVQEFPNAVIHVINGIVSVHELEVLADKNLKLLILGYKELRRGKTLYKDPSRRRGINENRKDLYVAIPEILQGDMFNTVSFDNLAIKQLDIRKLIGEREWQQYYMGDDNQEGKMTSASMYVDMVSRKFAANSCSPENERFDLTGDIDSMYRFLCERYNGTA